ncbi:hypothetical protein D3C85_374890 [compost metagenome]
MVGLCECCNQPNGWALMGPEYAHACGECAEDGNAELSDGVYREVKSCGCGRSGPINYDDGSSTRFYCGGSEYCIP